MRRLVAACLLPMSDGPYPNQQHNAAVTTAMRAWSTECWPAALLLSSSAALEQQREGEQGDGSPALEATVAQVSAAWEVLHCIHVTVTRGCFLCKQMALHQCRTASPTQPHALTCVHRCCQPPLGLQLREALHKCQQKLEAAVVEKEQLLATSKVRCGRMSGTECMQGQRRRATAGAPRGSWWLLGLSGDT